MKRNSQHSVNNDKSTIEHPAASSNGSTKHNYGLYVSGSRARKRDTPVTTIDEIKIKQHRGSAKPNEINSEGNMFELNGNRTITTNPI